MAVFFSGLKSWKFIWQEADRLVTNEREFWLNFYFMDYFEQSFWESMTGLISAGIFYHISHVLDHFHIINLRFKTYSEALNPWHENNQLIWPKWSIRLHQTILFVQAEVNGWIKSFKEMWPKDMLRILWK